MKRSILCLAFVFLIVVPNSWGATPNVATVTGTAQTGNVLTIQGANFLNENTSNWFMTSSQSRCEGSSPAADGWTQNGGTYDSSVKLTGTKSMRFSISGNGGSNCPTDNCADYVYRSPSASVMYARGYVRYSSSVQELFSKAAYVKMFYWMQAGVYVQPVVGSGWPSSMDVKIGANYKLLPLQKTWTADRWYCVEVMANHSNNTVQVWVDGQSIGTYSGSFAQDPFSFLIGFVNACPVPSGTFQMWTDSVALSTQRIYPITMVEIGNNSNYTSATKVAQPLVHADENQVQVSADLSGLGSGPYYVWITNNRQERSAAFQLGTSGDTTPTDTTKPTLSISSPSNGQTVTQSTVTVSGTASDASGIKSVTVNGSTCSGTTSWSKTVNLSAGSNTITVVATDNSSNQNQTSTTIQVTYSASTLPVADTTKPTLSISSPSNGQTVTQSTVTVSGSAYDASGIKSVTVNGSTCYGTTSWSKTVSLSAGSNTITVVATDNSSNQNQTSTTIQVTYSTSTLPVADTTKPVLNISSPSNGQTVNQSSVTVSGSAYDASGIKSVAVNGSTCYGTTSWSKTVNLNPGTNTITVVATDNSSSQNQTTRAIQVTNSASQTNDILSEDWEANSLSQFSDDISKGTFSIQSSVVHGGSRALVNNLGANVHDTGWATAYFGDNPYEGGDTESDVTLQWYTYWSPGFQFPLGQKMFSLACFESWSAGYPGYQSYAPYYISLAAINGQYFLQLESKTSGANVERNFYQNQGATITAQTGTWTALKVRAKLNTPGKSDGIVQMWVNGVLKLQYTDVNFRDSYTNYGWNMLMLTASASPVSPADQSMYWDDIMLTSSSSGTNLLPPSNLRIISTN